MPPYDVQITQNSNLSLQLTNEDIVNGPVGVAAWIVRAIHDI
jgi:hypothetical protein